MRRWDGVEGKKKKKRKQEGAWGGKFITSPSQIASDAFPETDSWRFTSKGQGKSPRGGGGRAGPSRRQKEKIEDWMGFSNSSLLFFLSSIEGQLSRKKGVKRKKGGERLPSRLYPRLRDQLKNLASAQGRKRKKRGRKGRGSAVCCLTTPFIIVGISSKRWRIYQWEKKDPNLFTRKGLLSQGDRNEEKKRRGKVRRRDDLNLPFWGGGVGVGDGESRRKKKEKEVGRSLVLLSLSYTLVPGLGKARDFKNEVGKGKKERGENDPLLGGPFHLCKSWGVVLWDRIQGGKKKKGRKGGTDVFAAPRRPEGGGHRFTEKKKKKGGEGRHQPASSLPCCLAGHRLGLARRKKKLG